MSRTATSFGCPRTHRSHFTARARIRRFRGTLVGLGGNAVLFTRGSVPYYRTYPGLRVPNPLMLCPHRHDTPLSDIARDVLALSKMNWNTTQFDGALPIPIRAAKQVGRVLKHVPIGQHESSEYSKYM